IEVGKIGVRHEAQGARGRLRQRRRGAARRDGERGRARGGCEKSAPVHVFPRPRGDPTSQLTGATATAPRVNPRYRRSCRRRIRALSMSTEELLAVPSPRPANARPPRRGHLRRSDLMWGIAFVAPYAAVFLAFVIYPFAYALWLASEPKLY